MSKRSAPCRPSQLAGGFLFVGRALKKGVLKRSGLSQNGYRSVTCFLQITGTKGTSDAFFKRGIIFGDLR
jgi:hypothetical protein